MSILLEKIYKKTTLKILDPKTDTLYLFKDLSLSPVYSGAQKKLAFLYLDNSFDSLNTFFRFYKSNLIVSLLSPDLVGEFKENLEQLYSPDYVYDLTRESLEGYEEIESKVYEIKYRTTTITFADEIKLLLSTSGTTGSPKFVKLSERNLLSNAQSIAEYLPIEHEDVVPLNLPIYYSYGLSILNSNAIAGGTIVCETKSVVEKEFWENFDKYNYCTFAGVPILYQMLSRIGFLKKDYRSLKYFTQAGGKLNPKLIKQFAEYAAKYDKEFYVMYGQTEATARMSYLEPSYLSSKPDSIGKAIKGGTFQIDPETSELVYEGPNVFGGYCSSLDDLLDYEQDKVLHTGDMATQDSDGFYYIIGRIKRFAKVFGKRINLDEVEQICKRLSPDLMIAAMNNQDDSKIVLAIESPEQDFRSLKKAVSDKLKIHPTYILVKLVETIPLTANGKIDYKALK